LGGTIPWVKTRGDGGQLGSEIVKDLDGPDLKSHGGNWDPKL
jgi:hypothetical protein